MSGYIPLTPVDTTGPAYRLGRGTAILRMLEDALAAGDETRLGWARESARAFLAQEEAVRLPVPRSPQ